MSKKSGVARATGATASLVPILIRDGGTGKAPRHVPNLKSEVYLIVFWRKFAF